MSAVDGTDATGNTGRSADRPRVLAPSLAWQDRVFRGAARSIGLLVLVIIGSIGTFLAVQSVPTLRRYGWRYFIENEWDPQRNVIGISAVLVGTVCIALVALIVAFPLALTTALYITEYSPARIKGTLVSLIDLMAAVPSIVYGLWGAYLLQPYALYVAHWLHQNFGFIPFFAVETDPNAPMWAQSRYTGSAFMAGLAVAMMVIPMGCAVMREVFAQAPAGEREAALALGATKWGVIRTVVLPFGRGGIIGGTMLSLGRALGETIAVVIIISAAFDVKIRILEAGSISVSSLIAIRFGEASTSQLSALLMAGFVLFLITLLVNTIASFIVSRSRSGASTEI